jgi:hypothetical protein
MGYNNYGNRQYNNNRGGYNNNGGGYNQQQNYNQPQQQQEPPLSPEEFIDERVALHQLFTNRIKEQGLDPADFAFALGAWVTSYVLERKRK